MGDMNRIARRPRRHLIRELVILPVLVISIALFVFTACGKKEQHAEKSQPSSKPAVQVPSFASRSRIAASGGQGPVGEAASLAGNVANGEVLFTNNCAYCHGPQGTDKVPNPGSDDGTVPPLNPIDPELANADAAVFAANIDRYIQHGSIPEGPEPKLFMPDWGGSGTLSQQQIADLEAYIMNLNGISR
jgi:mono/diheme cytochrome c family protein